MSTLRKKLEGTRGRVVIETVGSLGYRLLLDGGDRIHRDFEFAGRMIEPADDVLHLKDNNPV
jgi:hypothetical protein